MRLLSLLRALKWKFAVYFYMAHILENKLHFNAVYFLVKLHCSECILAWDGISRETGDSIRRNSITQGIKIR